MEERTLKRKASLRDLFRQADEKLGKQLQEDLHKIIHAKNIFEPKHLSIEELQEVIDVAIAEERPHMRTYWNLMQLKSQIKKENRKRGF